MDTLLPVLRWCGDAALAPFAWLPDGPGLVLLSAVLGAVLLIAFRYLSPQRAMRRVKDQMTAALYEMRIFADSPRLVLLAGGRSLGYVAVYFSLTLTALVVLAPVVGLLLVRAATLYEYEPLQRGAATMVQVSFDSRVKGAGLAVTAPGGGLTVERPIIVVASTGAAFFRVRADKAGTHNLKLQLGTESPVTKEVVVEQPGPISPVRSGAGEWDGLLSREPAITAGPINVIAVDYDSGRLAWLGLPWWVWLLLISMVVAFGLRNRFGVVL